MTKVAVKMCLHSSKGKPRFSALTGDTLLVRVNGTSIQEVVVVALHQNLVECSDAQGSLIQVPHTSIIAVCVE